MWLLMDPPLLSLVMGKVGPQGDPPNQPLISLLFFLHKTLPLQNQGVGANWYSGLLPPVVVVCHVAARELDTEAVVEGTARPTQGGQGGVATLNQGTRVLLMCPLVGMEATPAIAGDRGMAKPTAQVVGLNMLAGSEPVPSAMQEFAEVIVMREVGFWHWVSNLG